MSHKRPTIVGAAVTIFACLMGCAGIQGTYTQKAGGALVGVSRTLALGCDSSAVGNYYVSGVLVPSASISGRWRMAGNSLVVSWRNNPQNADERYKAWDDEMRFLVKGKKLKRVRTEKQSQKITDMVLTVGLKEIDRRYPFKRSERERCY